jgi:type II secretory pathway predicted ATPase ExeA
MAFESFGLSRDPFADTAGEGRLFAAAAAERTQTALQQAISESPRLLGRGEPRTRIVLLVGAAGVGKTTLIGTLRPRLEQAGWLVATWNAENAERQPFVSAVSLLETAFAATPVSVHLAAEHTAVAGVSVVQPHVAGLDRPTVLIIDDADALIEPTIEDLFQVKAERALKEDRCFCVVLVGTPSLVERCRDLDAVAARTARGDEIRLVRLQGLSEEEIEPYLADRLAAAGGVAASLFSADAITRIFAYSRGIPAVINRLAQSALALAEARGHRVVEAPLLDEAALDCWLDEEKVAYSGIDDLSAEQQPGRTGTEVLASPPSAGGADALATPGALVAARADQDAEPVLQSDAAADGVSAAPAAAAAAGPSAAEARDPSVAAAAAAAAVDAETADGIPARHAETPPAGDAGRAAGPAARPAAPASRWTVLAGFIRAQFGTGGRTIAAVAAVGALLVVGTATVLRQLAEPSPPQRAAEAPRPAADGRDRQSPSSRTAGTESPAATPATTPAGTPAGTPAAPTPASGAAAAAAVSAPAPVAVRTEAPPSQILPGAAGPAPVQAPPQVGGDPVLDQTAETPARPVIATGPIGDTGSLIERGTGLAALGNIAGARRFFEAAARRGDGRASILLARTYDPLFYPGSIVSGIRPDPEQAVRWYAEAERLGDAGATQRLRALKADPASNKRN